MHVLRGKKGKEGEKLSSFCWPKIPWRKNLHICSPSSFTPSRKGWLLLELIFPTFRRLGEILAFMYVLRWIKLCMWDGMAGVG
uniref:Uncharacterized protein n=1 Tax=Fagus sylvatica TaxID=28930 RepID=A0A2N9J0X4_FAGSY